MSNNQIEVGKIDPASLIAPVKNREQASQPQQFEEVANHGVVSQVPNFRAADLPDDRMSPWAQQQAQELAESQAKAAQVAQANPPMAAPAADPLDRTELRPNLVRELFERFGRAERKLHDAELVGDNGAALKVSCRPEVYEDQIWAMGVIADWATDEHKNLLISSDAQIRIVVGHLTAVATVLKVEGVDVWSAVGIDGYPAGTDYSKIPLAIMGQVREALYEIMQGLDANLLFQLTDHVENMKATESETEPESGDEGNSEAPSGQPSTSTKSAS